jgi:hypothetical protein
MKSSLVVAGLLAALAAVPAAGAQWEGRRDRGEAPRSPQQDNQSGQWHRGPPPDRHVDRDRRRDGAFSEEERRGLHRDLDRANRELYRRR